MRWVSARVASLQNASPSSARSTVLDQPTQVVEAEDYAGVCVRGVVAVDGVRAEVVEVVEVALDRTKFLRRGGVRRMNA